MVIGELPYSTSIDANAMGGGMCLIVNGLRFLKSETKYLQVRIRLR